MQNDGWTNLLAWSNANFANPTGWSSHTIPLPSSGDRTIDLAIDSQDRPHLVYASASMNLRYLQCTSNCETEDSVWQVQDVETGADVDASDPIAPCPDYTSSTWWLDGYASLALDALDLPQISYHAYHVQYQGSNYNFDAWAICFAHSGSADPYQNQRLYLPLLIR